LPTFLKTLGGLAMQIWRCYTRRLVPMMAAGVAFWFLLGLIPFLLIATSVSGYVFRTNPEWFHSMSTNILAVLPPGLGAKVLGTVDSTVAGWQTFGFLGIIALLFVSMGLFESIDWGINGAMGTAKRMGFIKGRLVFMAYVFGTIIFMSLGAVAVYTVNLVLAIPAFEPIRSHIPRRTFSMAGIWLYIYILYLTIPVRTPKWYRALIVAFVAAGVWTYLQKIGASLTVSITKKHAIYGALAGGTVFLTWMYMFAMIVLMGATVMDVWRRMRADPPEPCE
jgi:membrane protein